MNRRTRRLAGCLSCLMSLVVLAVWEADGPFANHCAACDGRRGDTPERAARKFGNLRPDLDLFYDHRSHLAPREHLAAVEHLARRAH
jgi:hypothetical protein